MGDSMFKSHVTGQHWNCTVRFPLHGHGTPHYFSAIVVLGVCYCFEVLLGVTNRNFLFVPLYGIILIWMKLSLWKLML